MLTTLQVTDGFVLSENLFMFLNNVIDLFAKGQPLILQKVKQHSSIPDLTVLGDGDAMIAVSGAYQGRIFTSTSKGASGRSYGWFNQEAIEGGNSNEVLHTLGGAGRMWFGPEIGRYSIFFDPGAEQAAENIKISPDLSNRLFTQIEVSLRDVKNVFE